METKDIVINPIVLQESSSQVGTWVTKLEFYVGLRDFDVAATPTDDLVVETPLV